MITQIQQSLYIFRLVEELVLYTAEGKYPFGPVSYTHLQIDRETFQMMLHQIMERFDKIEDVYKRQVTTRAVNETNSVNLKDSPFDVYAFTETEDVYKRQV